MSQPKLKDLFGSKNQMFESRNEAGKVPERVLGLRISEADHQALKVRAAQLGRSMTSCVQEAIHEWLEGQDQK